MKFGGKLLENAIDGWEHYYVDYQLLKSAIEEQRPPPKPSIVTRVVQRRHKLYECVSIPDGNGSDDSDSVATPPEQLFDIRDERTWSRFQGLLTREIEKVEAKYEVERVCLAQEKTDIAWMHEKLLHVFETIFSARSQHEKTQVRQLKVKLIGWYQRLSKLESFGIMNHTAVLKILKKHRKHKGHNVDMSRFFEDRLQGLNFVNAVDVEMFKCECERVYAELFCDGRENMARSELRLLKSACEGRQWSAFRTHFELGIILTLIVWLTWDFLIDTPRHKYFVLADPLFPLYRVTGCLILMVWGLGVNVYIWRRARVNFLYVFDLPQLKSRSPHLAHALWTKASGATMAWLISVVLYNKIMINNMPWPSEIPPGIIPVSNFVAFFVWIMLPLSNRKEVFKSVMWVLIAPFGRSTFFDTFVGDWMTSLAKVFEDMAMSMCLVVSGEFTSVRYIESTKTYVSSGVCHQSSVLNHAITPVLVALPLWFRFMQCIRRYKETQQRHPNMSNAAKYALALCVSLIGSFSTSLKDVHQNIKIYQAFWLLAFALSTLYTFAWDIRMDWGLVKGRLTKRNAGFMRTYHNTILRPQRMYPTTSYYVCIVLDFLLRFMWMLTIFPQHSLKHNKFALKTLQIALNPILAAAEIMRRTMWSCFRVENEHIANPESFRSEASVPITIDKAADRIEDRNDSIRSKHAVIIEIVIFVALVLVVAVAAAVDRT